MLCDAGVKDGAFLLVAGGEEPRASAPPFWRSPPASAVLPFVLGVGALVFLHSNLSATLASLFKNADAVLALAVAAYGWARASLPAVLQGLTPVRQFLSKYFDSLSEKFGDVKRDIGAMRRDTKAQFEEMRRDTKALFEALNGKLDSVLNRRWPWS